MKQLPLFLSIFILCFGTASSGNTIMICNSSAAYAYHDHYCRGLKACTHEVETVSIAYAKSIGKKACGYCC